MILAIDIGNTDITIGLSDGDDWIHVWRVAVKKDADQELVFGIRVRDFFLDAGLKPEQVDTIVVSSVVPDLTVKVAQIAAAIFGVSPVVVDNKIYPRLPLKILNPYQIGSDLVSNALAAYTACQSNCIVVDFGTALTFTVVAASGEIVGVAIVPGLATAVKSLSQSAARLFDVPLELPASVLGKNTVHAIQAGVLIGYEGLVIHMIARIKEELKDPECKVVATGGLSSIIGTLRDQFTEINPNLTLDGLRIIGNLQ